jgi:hypothetical protein
LIGNTVYRPYSEKGLWFAQGGPRNRKVSAVLLVDELMPWSVAHKTPILWHNPWAERPLTPNLWQGPQMIPDMSVSPLCMQFRDGKKGFEILNLYPEWPDESIENEDKPG